MEIAAKYLASNWKAGSLLVAACRLIYSGSGQAVDTVGAKALRMERGANSSSAFQVDTACDKGRRHLADAQFVVPLPNRLFSRRGKTMVTI